MCIRSRYFSPRSLKISHFDFVSRDIQRRLSCLQSRNLQISDKARLNESVNKQQADGLINFDWEIGISTIASSIDEDLFSFQAVQTLETQL